MNSFLGIGSNHEKYVYSLVYDTLDKFSPKTITLENDLRLFVPNWEPIPVSESSKYVKNIFNGSAKYRIRKCDNGILEIYIDNRRFDDILSEQIPSIEYAIKKSIPFYFVDIPIMDLRNIVKFFKGRVSNICLDDIDTDCYCSKYSIEELSDCKAYPTFGNTKPPENLQDFLNNIDKRFKDCPLTIRNCFEADAINFLFERGCSKIAHIGGSGHFNIRKIFEDNWEPFPHEYRYHLQDLVNAEDKTIIDATRGKTYTF